MQFLANILLAFTFLGAFSVAQADVPSQATGVVNNIPLGQIKQTPATNLYDMTVRLTSITNLPDGNIAVLFNGVGYPDIAPINFNGASIAQFDAVNNYGPVYSKLGVTADTVFIRLLNTSTNPTTIIEDVSLAESINAQFPDNNGRNPLALWPDTTYTAASTSAQGYVLNYQVALVGKTNFYGSISTTPLINYVLIIVFSFFGFCLLLSIVNWCCLPAEKSNVPIGRKVWLILGSALWLFLGGFFSGLGYIFFGLLMCCTIILIPIGWKMINFGLFALFPFCKKAEKDDKTDAFTCLGNMIWFVFVGLPMTISHVFNGIVLCLLIVTIPFGIQHFRLAKMALWPFGYSVVLHDDLRGLTGTDNYNQFFTL